MGALAEGLAIQITMYLIWQRACHRLQSHHTHRETHRALQPRQPRFTLPISTLDPAFLTTCRLLAGTDRPAQPAHAQQPHTARAPAGRWPGATRRPSQRCRGRLQTPTTQPMRQTSAQGPSRLRRAPQLAVDPLLGHPALHLGPGSAARIHLPTTDRKHGLVRLDGRFQKEHS